MRSSLVARAYSLLVSHDGFVCLECCYLPAPFSVSLSYRFLSHSLSHFSACLSSSPFSGLLSSSVLYLPLLSAFLSSFLSMSHPFRVCLFLLPLPCLWFFVVSLFLIPLPTVLSTSRSLLLVLCASIYTWFYSYPNRQWQRRSPTWLLSNPCIFSRANVTRIPRTRAWNTRVEKRENPPTKEKRRKGHQRPKYGEKATKGQSITVVPFRARSLSAYLTYPLPSPLCPRAAIAYTRAISVSVVQPSARSFPVEVETLLAPSGVGSVWARKLEKQALEDGNTKRETGK